MSEFNYSRRHEKEPEFFNESNKFHINQKDFSLIPGSPVAYWANDQLIEVFVNGKELSMFADAKQGLATADNNRFLRFWHEVDINKFGFGFNNVATAKKSPMKWFPYNKGGKFRKWYGNQEHVANWENDGYELKNFKKSVLRNSSYYFNKSLSWSKVTSGNIAFRYYPYGFLFDVAGCSIFLEQEQNMFYLLGFLNSKVCEAILGLISPTLNYEVGHIASLPVIYSKEYEKKVIKIVKENIKISQDDWDSFETSWNFKSHPILRFNNNTLEGTFNLWKSFKEKEFYKLKSNEIKLNEIFIDIFNVKGEVSPNVNDKDISLSRAHLERDIKSFISYSVGCMFGRYNIEDDGVIFAGGQWDPSKYSKFIPDDDNIIPILDTEYFEDDIVGKFVEFVKFAFGEENLEENLDFIASALKKKGSTSREVIRNYFLTDFYKDHVKTYKKSPIYWLFDSGRNNGFKALIYMQRYEPYVLARVRTNYLLKTQNALEAAISNNEMIIENSASSSEKTKAIKAREKLIKQLKETRNYDVALAHLANKKIEIDLDDGVKMNYTKFQGIEVSNEGKKLQK
ncbi:BREX-1 system adenine-specific DNA-methyltransferase PglX [Methanobacterium ferruginis]|uniref:BREX-1 system adenine-specific DNA-methyltransferase PglX n=1 Tax=Methanobacterium ferruginis TaxID=710191 RepID=UPI002573CF6E|nr:BREX-1 system adenine-specific DNA-methyltransferase PglX [Methanobacterium ferruginis]BDZ68767.1 hypothetical protein GCM10025860_22150 [Methanobacterium ferruginis]